nr:uncharacterized protein LOC117689471 isoform X3 [Crassostrea gigas]
MSFKDGCKGCAQTRNLKTRMKPLVLVAIVLLHVSYTQSQSDCPSTVPACTCEDITGQSRRNIRCVGLSQIPSFTSSPEIFQKLDMDNPNNNIQVIQANAFSGIKVEEIDMSGQNIKLQSIHPMAFSGFEQHLTIVKLQGDTVLAPPFEQLKNITNLQELVLQFFNMPTIEESTKFNYFPYLRILRLRNMNTNFVSSESFKNQLQELTVFEFANNQVPTFPKPAINRLRKLQHLSWVHNGMTTISYSSFDSLSSLTELDLRGNDIGEMLNGSFIGITDRLEFLSLQLNRITKEAIIPLGNHNWPELEQLNLGHMVADFTDIPNGLFRNMPKLANLMMPGNKLRVIKSNDFQGLGNMHSLDLSENWIHTIQRGALSPMTRLDTLDLRSQYDSNVNNPMNFSLDALEGAELALKTLHIQDNHLIDQYAWEAIGAMKNLVNLDISGTGLSDIPSLLFYSHNNLGSLTMRNNDMTVLRQESLYGLKHSLNVIDISNNQIYTIEKCVFEGFNKLNFIFASQNSFVCDCNLYGVHQFLKTIPSSGLIILTCKNPANLAGKPLLTLETGQFCSNPPISSTCLVFTTTTTSTSTTETTSGLTTTTISNSTDETTRDQITTAISNSTFEINPDFSKPTISNSTTETTPDFTTTAISNSTIETTPDLTTTTITNSTTETTQDDTTTTISNPTIGTTPDLTTTTLNSTTKSIISNSTAETTLDFTTTTISNSTVETTPDFTAPKISNSTIGTPPAFKTTTTPNLTTVTTPNFTKSTEFNLTTETTQDDTIATISNQTIGTSPDLTTTTTLNSAIETTSDLTTTKITNSATETTQDDTTTTKSKPTIGTTPYLTTTTTLNSTIETSPDLTTTTLTNSATEITQDNTTTTISNSTFETILDSTTTAIFNPTIGATPILTTTSTSYQTTETTSVFTTTTISNSTIALTPILTQTATSNSTIRTTPVFTTTSTSTNDTILGFTPTPTFNPTTETSSFFITTTTSNSTFGITPVLTPTPTSTPTIRTTAVFTTTTITTSTVGTTSVVPLPDILFGISNETTNTIVISWTVSGDVIYLKNFLVQYQQLEKNNPQKRSFRLDKTKRDHPITGLNPVSRYEICFLVELTESSKQIPVSCLTGTTKGTPTEVTTNPAISGSDRTVAMAGGVLGVVMCAWCHLVILS